MLFDVLQESLYNKPMASPLFNYTEVESLLNPKRGVERDRFEEMSLDELLGVDRSKENLKEWPRVHHLTRRGSLFVIEASTSFATALLRFDPDSLDRGYYLIRPGRSKALEEGRTIKVSPLKEPSTHPILEMLNPFKYRFAVRTISSARPLRELSWRIGFDDFKQFDDDCD